MAAITQNIDKLTNSIVNRYSGDSFDTEVIELQIDELKSLKKGWQFDWNKEFKIGKVYKLVIRHYPDVIQGLVSLIDKKDHLFMNLLESAPHNFGNNKIYEGVAGNLVAFSCKLSFENGYEGYVAFEPKTKLIDHYKKTLKAQLISSNRMIINSQAASILIDRYFNT
jgi:hypothetical protein